MSKNRNAFPKAKSKRLHIREIDREVLIYDLATHRASHLSPFAAKVWRCCDGTKSISDITEIVGDSINEDGVSLALERLAKADLLVDGSLAGCVLQRGNDRRALLRNLAAASLVPLVTNLPISARAQATAGTCDNRTDCGEPTSCWECVGKTGNQKGTCVYIC